MKINITTVRIDIAFMAYLSVVPAGQFNSRCLKPIHEPRFKRIFYRIRKSRIITATMCQLLIHKTYYDRVTYRCQRLDDVIYRRIACKLTASTHIIYRITNNCVLRALIFHQPYQ